MESISLDELAGELLETARTAGSGRGAHTVHGGHAAVLRQALIALAGGRRLDEHESPGEATLQVLRGRVRLTSGDDALDGVAGDLLTVPGARHALEALEDSVVLITIARRETPPA